MPHTDFDDAAATWDDDPAKLDRSRAIAAGIAATLRGEHHPDALEYGCGTGQVTWALADRLGHVILADASEGMLAVVRQRIEALPEDDRARFEARSLDLMAERLPEASMDLIYTSMALHHVADVPLVLRRFREALRPGGRVAIADLDHDPEGEFHGHDFDGHHGFERERLAAQLMAAGFGHPTFTTIATLRKPVGETDKEFPVFLAVAPLA